LENLAKVLAPFMPFIAEEIYQSVKIEGEVSVHLAQWPEVPEFSDGGMILNDMQKTRQVVSLGLEARAAVAVKVRQPLKAAIVKDTSLEGKGEMLDLIKDELNVKGVIFDPAIDGEVKLDTELTPELKQEGSYRELVRNLQELRKREGLVPEDKIDLFLNGGEDEAALVKKFSKDLKRQVGASDVHFGEMVDGRGLRVEGLTFLVKIVKSR
jgi:isoleucyl-tRNA synthetase